MKKNILFIGGDGRVKYTIDKLIDKYNVYYTNCDIKNLNAKSFCPYDLEYIKMDAVVLPIRGINKNSSFGHMDMSEYIFKYFVNSKVFYCNLTSFMEKVFSDYKLDTINVNSDKEFLLTNSIATAEGIIKLIIDELDIILKESKIMVIGYGACGKEIADRLTLLGSEVYVVARREKSRQEAFSNGNKVLDFDNFVLEIENMDIIVNTVPSLILDEEKIKLTKFGVQIYDVASSPGGVDYLSCNKNKVSAMLVPSIPSLVAPRSSGYALAKVINREVGGN